MSAEQIVAFFVFAVVAAVTPGPSNALVMVAGARAGFVGGLPCLAGVVVGMAMMMGGANLGRGGVVQNVPNAMAVLKGVGAALLLWLALTFAMAAALSCTLWLAFGASLQRWLKNDTRSRWFNVSMGIALAASVALVLR